mmetsp:Transcript_96076/g.233404  ORF Transcript_96076/g.233404 Transcript_96076/m.233404 type:complete len:321 (+) Transcript_96076:1168-2130(+)
MVNEPLRARPAAALREQRLLGAQLHAALEHGLGPAVLADAHIRGGDADDGTRVVQHHFSGRVAGEDVHLQVLGLLAEPTAQLPERDHVVAAVVHRRDHGERQLARLVGEEVHLVVAGLRLHRRTLFAPVRHQLVQRVRLEDVAGDDVRADFVAFFDDADGEVGLGLQRQLAQADGGRQPRRATADHQHVVLHAHLAWRGQQLRLLLAQLRSRRQRTGRHADRSCAAAANGRPGGDAPQGQGERPCPPRASHSSRAGHRPRRQRNLRLHFSLSLSLPLADSVPAAPAPRAPQSPDTQSSRRHNARCIDSGGDVLARVTSRE